MVERSGEHGEGHPAPLTYLKVATVLVILTAIEVGIFYLDMPNLAMVAIFLMLSLAKFSLVVMFYMHLKFDSRLFSGVFVGGLALAIGVSVALMSLFQVLGALANPEEGEVVQPPGTQVPGGTPTPGGSNGDRCAPDDRVCRGRELFLSVPSNAAPQALWCSTCHAVEGVSDGLIGPELTNIGTEGATRKPGMSAEQYIREAIQNPEAFVAPGVPRATPGLMTNNITANLTAEQLDLLVAFLLNPMGEITEPPPQPPGVSPTPMTAPPPTGPAPDGGDLVAEGENLFLNAPDNVGPQALWCSECHTVEGVSSGMIGPDLSHIGTAGAERKPGMSAEAYIKESIENPEAFVPSGVERAVPGLMTSAITEGLTPEQVAALTAFLLAQK